jgi:hypothetical protein
MAPGNLLLLILAIKIKIPSLNLSIVKGCDIPPINRFVAPSMSHARLENNQGLYP